MNTKKVIIDFFTKKWYKLLKKIMQDGGISIKKLHPKRKQWLEKESKKKQLRGKAGRGNYI